MLKRTFLASAVAGLVLACAPAWACGEGKTCYFMKSKQAPARSTSDVCAVAAMASSVTDAKSVTPARSKVEPNPAENSGAGAKAEGKQRRKCY